MSVFAPSIASAADSGKWPRVPLGEICRIDAPIVDPRKSEFRDLPHVSGEDIESGTGRLLALHSAAEDGMTSGKYLFDAGVVLYSKLRPYLRKVVFADFRGLCSADMYPLVFDRSRVCLDYAKFGLLSQDFTAYAIEASARARMPKLNREQLLAYGFPLPPLNEQERIAAELTAALAAVDKARRAAQERLAAAEAIPAAYLREVFEGPEASGWGVVRLADVAAIGGGIQKSPERTPQKHHRPYLTVRNVQRGYLDLSEVERFEITGAELERLRLQRGDILIVEGNGSADQIGRNAVFNLDGKDWIHQNHIIRVRLEASRLRFDFAALFLNSDSGKRQMVKRARTTSGLYTLSVEKVGSLQVPCPPLQVQQETANFLGGRTHAAQSLVGTLRNELGLIDALPAALLREAFNGND